MATTVLSCFDGMSCGRLALHRAGFVVGKYYASEIDPYAIKVSSRNFPYNINLGDVTNWREWDIDWASIDLLIGGSPCQGFSKLGTHLAFSDPRSALFMVFVEILEHIRKFNPNVKFLMENVRMRWDHIERVSGYLEVEPVFLNSKVVVPQSRERYYWSNFIWKDLTADMLLSDRLIRHSTQNLGFMLPAQSKLTPSDIIEKCDKDFKPATLRKGDPRRMLMTGNSFSCLTATYYKGINADGRPALATQEGSFHELREAGLCRGLTPLECERLQTVPENFTEGVSKTQRYRMLGNGWTVDMIAHLLSSY
jgi:site-specific DNA-cytosine methylase